MSKKPTVLLIMDGFGLAPAGEANGISCADTPHLDRLWAECPHTQLEASGLAVGLPEGQMGNSEVGHTNIGAGRVVYQDLPRISNAVADGSFFENEAYRSAMLAARDSGRKLHIAGLLSDGGVHSHIDHLFALLKMAKDLALTKVYVHAMLDGRDYVLPEDVKALAPAVLAHRLVMAVGGKMSESEALIAELCESCRVPIEDR